MHCEVMKLMILLQHSDKPLYVERLLRVMCSHECGLCGFTNNEKYKLWL